MQKPALYYFVVCVDGCNSSQSLNIFVCRKRALNITDIKTPFNHRTNAYRQLWMVSTVSSISAICYSNRSLPIISILSLLNHNFNWYILT